MTLRQLIHTASVAPFHWVFDHVISPIWEPLSPRLAVLASWLLTIIKWVAIITVISILLFAIISLPVYSMIYRSMVPTLVGASMPLYFIHRPHSSATKTVGPSTSNTAIPHHDDATAPEAPQSLDQPNDVDHRSLERRLTHIESLIVDMAELQRTLAALLRQHIAHTNDAPSSYVPAASGECTQRHRRCYQIQRNQLFDPSRTPLEARIELPPELLCRSVNYVFRLKMRLPDSPQNLECGMSSVTLSLYDSNLDLIDRFSRPVSYRLTPQLDRCSSYS